MKELTIAEVNRLNYGQPPSWEQIESLVNDMNMTYAQFERFYGIPYNQLTQIRTGAKKLPAYAWHFVYEKIKPAYGIGFVSDYNKMYIKKFKSKFLPKRLPQHEETIAEKHNRLTKVV
jgi:hypothetical protein